MPLTLRRSLFSRGAVVQGSPPPGDFVFPDVPVFDAGNSDHVAHVLEDWNYSSPSVIASTHRPADGGASWLNGGAAFQTLSTSNVDPWGGVKRLTIDLQDAPSSPPSGPVHQRGLNLEEVGGSPPQYFNGGASAKEQFIFENAFRMTGTAPYTGKIADLQPYAGTDRFNFQTGRDCLGAQMADNHCSDDTLGLCPLFFTGTLPGTMTALYPGMNPPPSPVIQGYAFARSIPGFLTYFYPQNANYGTGPGLIAAGGSGDATCGINFVDGVWRRFIIALSMNVGDVAGRGRIEQWFQVAGQAPIKVMEWVGDLGQRSAGKVFGRDTSVGMHSWITDSCTVKLWNLTAQLGIYNGGCTLDVGYVRIWTRSKPALP